GNEARIGKARLFCRSRMPINDHDLVAVLGEIPRRGDPDCAAAENDELHVRCPCLDPVEPYLRLVQFPVYLVRPEVKRRPSQTLGGTPSPRRGEELAAFGRRLY